MPRSRAPAREVWKVYALVCVAVFGVTRLESVAGVGRHVHLIVAAIFVLTAVHKTRDDPAHYGLALGGLLEPSTDDRSAGPFGLFDLVRAIIAAIPSALRALAAAAVVAVVVFPLYAVGYYVWMDDTTSFELRLPPNLFDATLAQLLVVALPEEAFFRGYVQTALTDAEASRVQLVGVELAPRAWLVQAALFAAVHFLVEPHPARLAVFFPGLLFGWVRAWRGGIGAALTLHAASNLYSEILGRSWL